jgi:hypothetical protein
MDGSIQTTLDQRIVDNRSTFGSSYLLFNLPPYGSILLLDVYMLRLLLLGMVVVGFIARHSSNRCFNINLQ